MTRAGMGGYVEAGGAIMGRSFELAFGFAT